MMEPMICETFLQFRYLSDLGLSPDGRYTAYIRQQANLASNGYDARLWVYDHSTGADRPLSSLSPVRAFSWMDNRTILFSGMRGTAGSASQDTTTYYALPVDGGEAQPLFTVPMRAGRARRLTDGRFVFTATVDMNRPNLDSLSPPEEASALEEYKNRTYDVLEDIPFWSNGLGLTSGQRSQLYIHDPASGVTTPPTAPPFKVTGFTVEGGRILYTGHRFTDVQTLRHGVFIWDAASGETRCLLEQDPVSGEALCPLAGPGGSLSYRRAWLWKWGKWRFLHHPSLRRRTRAAPPPQPSLCGQHRGHRQPPWCRRDLARLRRHALFPLHRGPGQPD